MAELKVPFAMDGATRVLPHQAQPQKDYLCSSEACQQIVRVRALDSDLVQTHFFHLHEASPDCCWEGLESVRESKMHYEAKYRLIEMLQSVLILDHQPCTHQSYPHLIQGRGVAEAVLTVDGQQFRLDVGVYDLKGQLVAALEVYHKHRCPDEKMWAVQTVAPVYEISAEAVMAGLPLKIVNSDSFSVPPCETCRQEAAERMQRGHAAQEATRAAPDAPEVARQQAHDIAAEKSRQAKGLEDRRMAAWLALAELTTTVPGWTAPPSGSTDSSQPYFSGRVNTVVYENGTNAFYILKMVLDTAPSAPGAPVMLPVTAKGSIPGLQVTVGTWFGFEGKWVNDATYGKQLNITRAPVLKGDWDADTAVKMLAANGVSTLVVQSIQQHYGDDDLLDVLSDVGRMAEVPGVTQFTAMHVAARWATVKAHFESMDFLASMGLPPGLVRSVWAYFGGDASKILTRVPWALVEVEGITFAQADEVARRSGLLNPAAQVRAAVLFACKSNQTFGHLFLRTGNIFQVASAALPGVTQEQVLQALGALSKEGLVIIDRKTRPGTSAVYEPWVYEVEKASAEHLIQRNQLARFQPGDARTVSYLKALGSVGPQTVAAGETGEVETRLGRAAWAAIEEWGAQAHLVLSEPQKEGIFYALTAPVSILSGLPGTGKTTSLQAAVRILQDAGVPFLLCAPTGIAAKNLAARTGAAASTIHRAFSAKGTSERRGSTYAGVTGAAARVTSGPGDSEWGYSQENPHPAEVVIIDEASMLDQHLLYRLLDCTKPTARLVFVGDHAQLPSVGPGNVLRDLIASEVFPTVKLTQIFRQDDTSGIVFAAHSIHAGDVPELNKDFRLLALQSEDDVLDAVLKIGARFKEEHKNFQILSPKHGGTVGVTNLNARLRELLNPAGPGLAEYRIGNDIIREGDRIMVIQNEYKLGIFNGDVGKVSKVDKAKKQLEIRVYGDIPSYIMIDFKDVARLIRLAYACTVHKAQGLEYDIIVMPLVMSFYHQLQRNLLYTAITRAKKQVVLIGHPEALAKAVFNAKEDERATLFLDRLLRGPVLSPSV